MRGDISGYFDILTSETCEAAEAAGWADGRAWPMCVSCQGREGRHRSHCHIIVTQHSDHCHHHHNNIARESSFRCPKKQFLNTLNLLQNECERLFDLRDISQVTCWWLSQDTFCKDNTLITDTIHADHDDHGHSLQSLNLAILNWFSNLYKVVTSSSGQQVIFLILVYTKFMSVKTVSQFIQTHHRIFLGVQNLQKWKPGQMLGIVFFIRLTKILAPLVIFTASWWVEVRVYNI